MPEAMPSAVPGESSNAVAFRHGFMPTVVVPPPTVYPVLVDPPQYGQVVSELKQLKAKKVRQLAEDTLQSAPCAAPCGEQDIGSPPAYTPVVLHTVSDMSVSVAAPAPPNS